MTDARVTAIRADAKIGKGSLSSIDECWTDAELIQDLDEYPMWNSENKEPITDPSEAVAYFQSMEGIIQDHDEEMKADVINDAMLGNGHAAIVYAAHAMLEPDYQENDPATWPGYYEMLADEAEREAKYGIT